MALDPVPFTTAVGRVVAGSVSELQTHDFKTGAPLTIKKGPKLGQATTKLYFALAIPKNGTQHWASEPTVGAVLWKAAHDAWGADMCKRPDFAFKVTDGDSQVVNRENNKPCDNEGWPGHWIFHFGQPSKAALYNGLPPNNVPGSVPPPLVAPLEIKRGYWVQVSGTIASNETSGNPGMYLNPQMVALRGYDKELSRGPNVATAGFNAPGAAAMPAHVSTTPIGGTMPAPGHPAVATPPIPGTTAAPPLPVVPNPGFPGNAAAPPPPGPAAPPPPAGPQFVMTGTAGAFTREQMHAANWTDAAMIAAGHMRQG